MMSTSKKHEVMLVYNNKTQNEHKKIFYLLKRNSPDTNQ